MSCQNNLNTLRHLLQHPRFVRARKAVVCSISEVSAQLWVCLCFLLSLTHNCCDIGMVQNTLLGQKGVCCDGVTLSTWQDDG